MDDLWHVKACDGLERNSSQPSQLSASITQFEMNSGLFGHPRSQQELCVVERTLRQEPLGANILGFGIQGSAIKSVGGDVRNSLLALVPGSHHHGRTSYQSAATPRQTFLASNPQVASLGSAIGDWPGHFSNLSAGNCVSGPGPGHGADTSLNVGGRAVNSAMLEREVNLAQSSRMVAGRNDSDASMIRTSGLEVMKPDGVTDYASDTSGQGAVPPWLTSTMSSQQKGRNTGGHMFISGPSLQRVADASQDSTNMRSFPEFSLNTMPVARAVCINYETGQKIGGELCLTQLGLLGVLCSCHGSHMSVAKFTQHVGIYSANPGGVVVLDGSGESLVQWRRTFFSQRRVKVPEDNQGWDWSDNDVDKFGPTNYKATVPQSWQKEIDVSGSDSSLRSRYTPGWAASMSPSGSANFQTPHGLGSMSMPSSLEGEALPDSRETCLTSAGQARRAGTLGLESCSPAGEVVVDDMGKSRFSTTSQTLRMSAQLGASPSAEFFNFISGGQQFMSDDTDQVAAERQAVVSSRSLLQGLDFARNDRRDSYQNEKDNCLSSFELRLGQPSQQAQPVGPPISTALASQMQRVMMQTVLDPERQHSVQGNSSRNLGALRTCCGHQRPSTECIQHQNFARAGFMDPNCRATESVLTGFEGNSSFLGDHARFRRVENGSSSRIPENIRDKDNNLRKDADGVQRWSSIDRNSQGGDTYGVNSVQSSRFGECGVHQRLGDTVQSARQRQQDLDIPFGQGRKYNSSLSQHAISVTNVESRVGQALGGGLSSGEGAGNCSTCIGVREMGKSHARMDSDTACRGSDEGQGCVCSNRGKSPCAIVNEKSILKPGERQDFCLKEVDVEGELSGQVIRDANPGPTTTARDWGSGARGRRLKSFQKPTSQGCFCGVSGSVIDSDRSVEVCTDTGTGTTESLTEKTPPPASVLEIGSGAGKTCNSSADGEVVNTEVRESRNETSYLWKEIGGAILVAGSEAMGQHPRKDGLSPLRIQQQLEEDLLADTATKASHSPASAAAAVGDGGASDKQEEPASDVCSKSSENNILKDGTTAAHVHVAEVPNPPSQQLSVDKKPLSPREVVDEGSGIGKCSSSDGVDMGVVTPNLNLSCKDDAQKLAASPGVLQEYPPTDCNSKDDDDDSAREVQTWSRGDNSATAPAAKQQHQMERERDRDQDVAVSADTGKVERKRRRTLKWKRLDATCASADAKKQKISTTRIMAENCKIPQKSPVDAAPTVSTSEGARKEVDCSPVICANVDILERSPGTHPYRQAAATAPHVELERGDGVGAGDGGPEATSENGLDTPPGTGEQYSEKKETLVIRVPQGLNRKKAKRSGRSRSSSSKKTMGGGSLQDHAGGSSASLSASPEKRVVGGVPPPVDCSISKESNVTTGSSLNGESAALSSQAMSNNARPPLTQVLKVGKATIGRPNPSNATRMVSLKEIMNKSHASPPPWDFPKPLPDGGKELASGSKVDSMSTPTPQPCRNAGMKASALAPSKEVNGSKQCSTTVPVPPNEATLINVALNTSGPEEASRSRPLLKEAALKVDFSPSPKDRLVKSTSSHKGSKAAAVLSQRDRLEVHLPMDGPRRKESSFPKDCLNGSSSRDASRVSSHECDSKVFTTKYRVRKVSPGKHGSSVSVKDAFVAAAPFTKTVLRPPPAKIGSNLSAPAKECLKGSTSKESLKVAFHTTSNSTDKNFSQKDAQNCKRVPPPAAVDGSKVLPQKFALKTGASTKNHQESPVPQINLQASTVGIDLKEDFIDTKGHKGRDEDFSKNVLFKASGFSNGLKAPAAPKELSDVSPSNVSPRVLFPSCTAEDGSNGFSRAGGFETVVPVSGLKTVSKASTRALKKLGSRLGDVAVSEQRTEELFPSPLHTWTGSGSTCIMPHKQEARKVRSLHEITAERKLPSSGLARFHDDDAGKSQGFPIPRGNKCSSRCPEPSTSAISVPVQLTENKFLSTQGERLRRGDSPTVKESVWRNHKPRSVLVNPVEIVVGGSFTKGLNPTSGTSVVTRKTSSHAELLQPLPVRSHKLLLQSQVPPENGQGSDVAFSNVLEKSSISAVRKRTVVHEGLPVQQECNGVPSVKSVVEQAEIPAAAPSKKQKLLDSAGLSGPTSDILKVRRSLQKCLPAAPPEAPSSPPVNVADLERKKGSNIRRQSLEDDFKISGQKGQRQKWFPEGVVECCVCGSSVSEFCNQIVCCRQCPVKVHQACYGIKKISNAAWFCRTCKANAIHPICVLCGYGGGAMTRAQKANGFVKALVKVWQDNSAESKEKADTSVPISEVCDNMRQGFADQHLKGMCDLKASSGRAKHDAGRGGSDKLSGVEISNGNCPYFRKDTKVIIREASVFSNTVTSGAVDSGAVQWVHMVCALWMPGTRCLNIGTMGTFDVSGVPSTLRKLLCSICQRKSGACIQCRALKCGIPFHPWCAHEKGLLQSEIVEDGSDRVGFFGKCLHHGKMGDSLIDTPSVRDVAPQNSESLVEPSTCARTEGFKGKLTLLQRALSRRQATRSRSAAVSPEQIAAWLRINERKTSKAKRLLKSANSDQKTDHREYLRFKQEQGWRRLSVYKSGIHALGLYTAEFIGRGEMVVEYIGEIVGLRVADKREADYHSGKRMQYQAACYLFRIDKERIIDATRKGGIARFVNHSCSPNCVAKVISVKTQSKVVFFAQRDIYAGEEITYDYQFNFEQEGDKIPCFCGSEYCRGTLN